MKSDSGTFDRRVTFIKRSVSKDASGVAIEAYAIRAEVWARVQELSGRQFVQARQQDVDATVKVRIRFRDDIGDTDRLVYRGRVYEIVHRAEFGRADDLELLCNELDEGVDQAVYDAANDLGLIQVSNATAIVDFVINDQLAGIGQNANDLSQPIQQVDSVVNDVLPGFGQ